MTKEQLEHERDIGNITSDFSTTELVNHAIINEDYTSTVKIYFTDSLGNTVIAEQKICDYFTRAEHNYIIMLNEGI